MNLVNKVSKKYRVIADYGDVTSYFNPQTFFSKEALKSLPMNILKNWIQTALDKNYSKFDSLMIEELKKIPKAQPYLKE